MEDDKALADEAAGDDDAEAVAAAFKGARRLVVHERHSQSPAGRSAMLRTGGSRQRKWYSDAQPSQHTTCS